MTEIQIDRIGVKDNPQVQELVAPLNDFLGRSDEAKLASEIEERAALLETSLLAFTNLNTAQREEALPTLHDFIMQQAKDEDGEQAIINTEVLISLADEVESTKLRAGAELLSDQMVATGQNKDGIKFFTGSYEITELNTDGSVKAHVINPGNTHKEFGGSLAHYSLIKAVLGHHLLLAKDELPDWKDVGNSANIEYFEQGVGLPRLYVGNHGRAGGSGISMTKEVRDILAGGVLDNSNTDEPYFMEGEADSFGVKTAIENRDRAQEGLEARRYIFMPASLDISRSH
jgi:hypothetical protein